MADAEGLDFLLQIRLVLDDRFATDECAAVCIGFNLGAVDI